MSQALPLKVVSGGVNDRQDNTIEKGNLIPKFLVILLVIVERTASV